MPVLLQGRTDDEIHWNFQPYRAQGSGLHRRHSDLVALGAIAFVPGNRLFRGRDDPRKKVMISFGRDPSDFMLVVSHDKKVAGIPLSITSQFLKSRSRSHVAQEKEVGRWPRSLSSGRTSWI